MQLLLSLVTAILAPISLAAPARDVSLHNEPFYKRENLCNLKAPPALCKPDPTVSVEETALRAYKFYRAFVVDGDPRTMFSLIDSSYIRLISDSAKQQHHPGYQSGPNVIWPLFCNGNKLGSEKSTAWCFDASTNMSYARYSTTDRWRWVDGCVHEHWDQGESIPTAKCYKLNTTTTAS
ncbi:hypothetical protein NUW58_g6683 [Xylaria curta]|uniref:Uncharacterized protein n=1 Tax=Xylaria curta TaxID=42375 RepID=A0ACC1NQA7_9PEZI|nr:hypothetical protein NUW58_g6683 [Xylaria curta]